MKQHNEKCIYCNKYLESHVVLCNPKSKTWLVSLHQSVGVQVRVTAETEDEARELAEEGEGKIVDSDCYGTDVIDVEEEVK